MNKHYELLMGLSQAPDDQIAGAITPKFVTLAQQDTVKSDEMLAILDQCAYGALASEFSMFVLNKLWTMLCEDEGITPEQGLAAAEPRRKAWETMR